MGSVSLTATAETQYHAEITHNSHHQVVPLASADVEGMTLAADVLTDTTRPADHPR